MHTVQLEWQDRIGEGQPFRYADNLREIALERWDRTIGALGGEADWTRLISLRIGIAGCGRSGAIAALAFARLGVRKLVLVDPDAVELHNLGEMPALAARHIGLAKVTAIADAIQTELAGIRPALLTISEPVQSQAAISALKTCDVLVSCPDSDAARLTLALLAALYHRVLIDVGSGIHSDRQATNETTRTREFRFGSTPRPWTTAGADVRLIVPGHGSCLLCHGGLADYEGALDAVCNRSSAKGSATRSSRRVGSLTYLNQIAVGGLTIQMLIDLVSGRLQDSTWARLDLGSNGRMTVRYDEPASAIDARGPCRLCAKAGFGDLGW